MADENRTDEPTNGEPVTGGSAPGEPAPERATAIVTGANTGIGLVTATELARRGHHVVVTCRSEEKGRATVGRVRADGGDHVDHLVMDLADLGSVRAAADRFLDRGLPLAVLVNNAGVARLRGRTVQGFENTFGINHLGPFLFTLLLAPALDRVPGARVVNVASMAHSLPFVRGLSFDRVRRPTSFIGLREYGESKLANILFSAELARRNPDRRLRSYALHPGEVATDVWRNAPGPVRAWARRTMLTPEEGARTTLYCATSDQAGTETGRYYAKSEVVEPSPLAQDLDLARELWERSLEWVGEA